MSIRSAPRLLAGLPVAAHTALHGAASGLPPAPLQGCTQGTASHPLLAGRAGPLPATTSVAPRTASVRLQAAFPRPSSVPGVQNEAVLQAMLSVRGRIAEGGVPLRLSHPEPQLIRALDTALRGWMALARKAAGG